MEPQVPDVQQPEVGQQVLFNIEELVGNATRSTTELERELKKRKEMLKDGYINEPTYNRLNEDVKVVKKKLLEFKSEVDKQPSVIKLKSEIKDMTQDLKERRNSISDYALEYERISGANQIEIDGDLYQIVKSAKLVTGK